MKKQEYIEKYGEEAYKRCLERQRKYQKQYREQHKNEIREYQQQHKNEIREYQQQYKEEHREEHKEYMRKYYQQNKDEYNQYREQHKDEYNQYQKQYMRKYNSMFSYCIPEEIEQIENYELAKADNFNGWHIHHKLECVETGAVVNSTRQDLIDWGIYYNRPASELIFLTSSEHQKLHSRKKNREEMVHS